MNSQQEVKDFLTNNKTDTEIGNFLKQMLAAYFNPASEATEAYIVEHFKTLDVVEDPKNKTVYVIKITMEKELLLRNRSRVEYNLLSAIRELIALKKPNTKSQVISKVEVLP